MNPLVSQALVVAAGEVGVREAPLGSNRGPQVDRYLAAVGLAPGNPWCAAFIADCIGRAARALGVANPWKMDGYCPDLQAWARALELLRADPEPGDVFLLVTNGRAHHTGFVTARAGELIGTIEGNTNLGGSPEGIGVFRRSRHTGPDLVFIHWEAICPAPPVPWKITAGAVDVTGIAGAGDTVLAPVRVLCEALGRKVEWHQETQKLFVDGRPVPVELAVIGGRAYAALRPLAGDLGWHLAVDETARKIVVSAA